MPLNGFESDVFSISLENTRNNLTHHEQSHCQKDKNIEKSSGGDEFSIRKVHKLKRKLHEELDIDKLLKKPMLWDESIKQEESTSAEQDVEPMETSPIRRKSINISQEDLTLLDTIDDSFAPIINAAKRVILSITESSASNIQNTTGNLEVSYRPSDNYINLWQNYMEKKPLRKKRLEEFGERMLKYSEIIKKNVCVLNELYKHGMEEFKRPYKLPNFEEIESSSTSSINNDSESTQEKLPFLHIGRFNSTTEYEKVLSLQEKIEAKHKR
ncbi:hypothetical protein ILUMI_10872 [Ignelater luminosus]|uniref:Uncharacterized protein n=1 Tax=Ignelater luminosus TaxID=2038154 RepID=A0A8K0CX13_IGNLU|nr:hypothetical protein ILUMI_10872 [Ignelater luminosus]